MDLHALGEPQGPEPGPGGLMESTLSGRLDAPEAAFLVGKDGIGSVYVHAFRHPAGFYAVVSARMLPASGDGCGGLLASVNDAVRSGRWETLPFLPDVEAFFAEDDWRDALAAAEATAAVLRGRIGRLPSRPMHGGIDPRPYVAYHQTLGRDGRGVPLRA